MRHRVAAIVLFLLLLAGVTGAAGKIVSAKFINDSTTMINGFYAEDKNMKIRKSHENPVVKEIYDTYLEAPGSEKAHHILHTTYAQKERYSK